MSDLLAAALDYAARGWSVFPIQPGGKRPIGALAPNGVLNATTSEVVIRAWWHAEPTANIGVATGEKSGMLVVDVDPDAGGRDALQALMKGHYLPPVVESETGGNGGGWHVWFAYPKTGRYGNTASKIGEGIDTRGEGGYVVAPPSKTERHYTWLHDWRAPLPDIPDWLLDLLTEKPAERPALRPAPPVSDAYAKKALEDELTNVALSQEGSRNDTLNSAAFSLGQLVGAGLLEHAHIESALTNAGMHAGLPYGEAHATTLSGMRAGMREPRRVPERERVKRPGTFGTFNPETWPGADPPTAPSDFTDLIRAKEDAVARLGGVPAATPSPSSTRCVSDEEYSENIPPDPDALVSLAGALGGYFESVEAAKAGGTGGVPTGFADLDRLLGGLKGGDLVVLAARPSVGKSALAFNVARHAAEAGVAVLIFSLEMSAHQIAERLVAAEARVDAQRLRQGEVDEAEWARVGRAFETLSALPVWLRDDSTPSLDDIVRRAKRGIAEKGVGLVVVDYIGLVKTTGARERHLQVGEISRGLKALARDGGVPVLALSQLNRAVEGRADHRPLLSDLRESGSIEQDADVVLLLARDEVHTPTTDRRGIADLICAKSRNGPTGTVVLRWHAEQVRFADIGVYEPDRGYSHTESF